MKVTGTPAAALVVDQVRRHRTGALVFTIGTGCCESTAPFLYEDFWPGPDHEVVGEVAEVPVYAPAHLRQLYRGDDGLVIDVEEGVWAESFSVETEYGCRFVFRAAGDGEPGGDVVHRRADVPPTVSALRPRGPQALPESLERLRALQTQTADRSSPRPAVAPGQ